MTNTDRPAWINILLWLASAGSMIGIMIFSSRHFEETETQLLIEFLVITAVILLFLYLISGTKHSGI